MRPGSPRSEGSASVTDCEQAARFSDASLTMMISDLCAQHPKLTGIRKEQNAVYLKELVAEKVRRAA